MTEAARNVVFQSTATSDSTYNPTPSSTLSQGSRDREELPSSNLTESNPNTIINTTFKDNNMSSPPEVDTEGNGEPSQERENNRNERNSPLNDNLSKPILTLERDEKTTTTSDSNNYNNDHQKNGSSNSAANSSNVHTSFSNDASYDLLKNASTLTTSDMTYESTHVPPTRCNTVDNLVEHDIDDANSGGEMASYYQGDGIVEESIRHAGGLPPPTPIPEQAQVYMKGKYQSEDGFHKCKGHWAYKLEHHNNDQDEMFEKGYISKFQFELDSPQEGPANGEYHGYWMWLPSDKKERVRQIDKFIDLKFEPNSNTPNGYNVSGQGEADLGGKFLISGTYDKSTGDMLIFRNYFHEKKVTKPRAKRGPKLARDQSSFTNSGDASMLTEPSQGPSLLPRAESSMYSRMSRPRKATSMFMQDELDKGMSKCFDILKNLMGSKRAKHFKEPVDLNVFTDYLTRIEEPMDLGTVRSMIERRELNSREEFARLVRLTFQNAMKYTPQDTVEVHQDAFFLLDSFEQRYSKVRAMFDVSARGAKRGPGIKKKNLSQLDNSDDDDDDMEMDFDDDDDDDGGGMVRGQSIHNMDRFSETMSNKSFTKRRAGDKKSVASGESNSKRSGRGGGRGSGAKRGGGTGRGSKLVRTNSMKSSQRGSERGSQNGDGRTGRGRGRGRGANRSAYNANSNYMGEMDNNMMNYPPMMNNPMQHMMGFGMNPMMMMNMNPEIMDKQIEMMKLLQQTMQTQQGGQHTSPTEKKPQGRRPGPQKGRANNGNTNDTFPAPEPRQVNTERTPDVNELTRPLNGNEKKLLLHSLETIHSYPEGTLNTVLDIMKVNEGDEIDVDQLSAPISRTLLKFFEKLDKQKR